MPFVVTVAVAANACGGTVVSGDGERERSTGGNGTGGGYMPGAGGTGAGGLFGGGANPPYYAGGSPSGLGGSGAYECPPTVPQAGMACYLPDQITCAYPDSGPCELAYSARCDAGTWTVLNVPSSWSCNPPPPPPAGECPTLEPKVGTYCNYAGPTCGYGELCMGAPWWQYDCVGSVWQEHSNYCNPPYPPPVDAGAAPIPGDAGSWP